MTWKESLTLTIHCLLSFIVSFISGLFLGELVAIIVCNITMYLLREYDDFLGIFH